MKFKIHYFVAEKSNASLCNVRPFEKNWFRKDFCTLNIKKVTCKNCLKVIKNEDRR